MTTLQVHGAVERPREFSFDDLSSLSGQIADISTRIPGRQGSGVSFASLVEAVGVKNDATHVTVKSTDGSFSASVSLEDMKEALVAYRLGEDPLPTKQGGPLRFFIHDADTCKSHGSTACANVKGLGELEFTVGQVEDTRWKS